MSSDEFYTLLIRLLTLYLLARWTWEGIKSSKYISRIEGKTRTFLKLGDEISDHGIFDGNPTGSGYSEALGMDLGEPSKSDHFSDYSSGDSLGGPTGEGDYGSGEN